MSETPALRLALNQLLKDIPANREQIFLAMRELAMCKARRIHIKNWQDKEDVISESVLHVMGRLDKYNPDRRAACAYFGLMLRRKMLALLQEMQGHKTIHDQIPPSNDPSQNHKDCSILDRAPHRRLPRLSGWCRRDAQVRGAEDRERVKSVLDEALANACRVAADAAEGEEMERTELAIGILQHVRKALLGRFNRVEADHQREAAHVADTMSP